MIAPNSSESSELDFESETPKENRSHVDAILRDVKEIAELAGHYLAARKDSAFLQFRKALVFAAIGLMALSTAIVACAAAAVMLLLGIADGLGTWLGHPWLGRALVGGLILGGMALLIWVGLKYLAQSSQKRTISRYAFRHARQRAEFGRDARECPR